jgi:hypothetical protein
MRIRPEHAVIVSFALVAAVVAAAALHAVRVADASPNSFLAGTVLAVIGGVTVGVLVLRAPSQDAMRGRALVGCASAAAMTGLATAACFVAGSGGLSGVAFDGVDVGPAVFVLAAAGGLVPGLCAAIVLIGLVRVLHDARFTESQDLLERVAARALERVGALAAASVFLLRGVEVLVAVAALLVASALLAACAVRDLRRLLWLRRAFVDPRFVLVAHDESLDERVLPIVGVGAVDAVLCRATRAADPYRDAPSRRPIGLVGGDLKPLRARLARTVLAGLSPLAFLEIAAFFWVDGR